MSRHLVFVYGSLKRGFRNHCMLEGSRFIGDAHTLETFRMHSMGGAFPAVVPDEDGAAIEGEVYSVDDEGLARLDRLEGYPRHYDRKQVKVDLGVGRHKKAWIYFYHKMHWGSVPAVAPDADGLLRWV
jgi:gamma-glutamylaminecyclotransferase